MFFALFCSLAVPGLLLLSSCKTSVCYMQNAPNTSVCNIQYVDRVDFAAPSLRYVSEFLPGRCNWTSHRGIACESLQASALCSMVTPLVAPSLDALAPEQYIYALDRHSSDVNHYSPLSECQRFDPRLWQQFSGHFCRIFGDLEF